MKGTAGRVARTKLICAECGAVIKPGHRYYWKQVKRGSIIHVIRVCSKCKEHYEREGRGKS